MGAFLVRSRGRESQENVERLPSTHAVADARESSPAANKAWLSCRRQPDLCREILCGPTVPLPDSRRSEVALQVHIYRPHPCAAILDRVIVKRFPTQCCSLPSPLPDFD